MEPEYSRYLETIDKMRINLKLSITHFRALEAWLTGSFLWCGSRKLDGCPKRFDGVRWC